MSQLRHNLRNTYLMLQGHLRAGEYDKAMAFIDKNVQKVSHACDLIHTGSSAIDSVLEEKMELMKNKNIQYTENISRMYLGKISDSELSIVIGLAFDNAIEASEKIDGPKEIIFSSRNHINYLILEMSNSIVPGSQPQFYKSTKVFDGHRHGFGIKSIKDYIAAYQGDAQYEIKGDRVILTITLNTE